jgi:hypothetical protein
MSNDEEYEVFYTWEEWMNKVSTYKTGGQNDS